MRGGGGSVLCVGKAARRRDVGANLRARHHPAVPGLGARAQLDFDHLDLILRGAIAEAFGVEPPHLVAAAEIAAAEFPDDVAAVGAVIGAETALAGVVIAVAEPRAEVKRLDRLCAERAEAHRSEERRVGKEWVRTSSYVWSQYPSKKKHIMHTKQTQPTKYI